MGAWLGMGRHLVGMLLGMALRLRLQRLSLLLLLLLLLVLLVVLLLLRWTLWWWRLSAGGRARSSAKEGDGPVLDRRLGHDVVCLRHALTGSRKDKRTTRDDADDEGDEMKEDEGGDDSTERMRMGWDG